MNSLVKSLISPFLNEEEISNVGKNEYTSTIGVFGGGFKPPTKGHFEVAKQALKMYPNLDKFIIYVGTGGDRSKYITQAQSLAIWNIYKDKLPSNKIEIISSANPRMSVYNLRRENPSTQIKWFIGSREGNEQDEKDYQNALSTIGPTRPNLELINIVTPEEVSGTKARQVLTNRELLFNYLPNELTDEEKEEIFNILNPMSEGEEITSWVNEVVPEPEVISKNNFFEPLQDKQIDINISSEPTKVDYYKEYYKNLSPTDFKVDKDKDKIVISNINKNGLEHNPEFKELLVSLTMYMMDHINIEPLPDLIFIEDDVKNAKDLLGKTAYYNPENKSITLYTLNRHPKDILRSYAHEMIHHKQNLEGRLTNIQGHDINEDDYLKEIELEAYKYGNGEMFRGWENSL